MNKLGWLLSLCLVLAVATGQGISTVAHGEAIATVSAGELHGLINKYQGKVVVVNFWASWCPPCRKEFPDIIKLYDEHHSKGLEVIAVSMNAAEEIEDIEKFLRNFEPPFPVYRAATVDETFYERVVEKWFGEIPVTLIFDAAGKPIHFYKRPVTYGELAKNVTALLPVSVR